MSEQSKIWQHVKSGGLYKVMCDGLREHDLEPVVIYESLWDGAIWLRPSSEFHDGRFRNIAVGEITDCRPEAERSLT